MSPYGSQEYRKFKRPFPLAACAHPVSCTWPPSCRRVPAARQRPPRATGTIPRHARGGRPQARAAGPGDDCREGLIQSCKGAGGLEFRAVAVMACDDEIIPLQARIETVADDADLEEVYHTERHLLYVACTRARDQLLVTSVDPASEFLDDLRL